MQWVAMQRVSARAHARCMNELMLMGQHLKFRRPVVNNLARL
jgi:hypothetical protein